MGIDRQIRICIEGVNRYRYAIPQPIDIQWAYSTGYCPGCVAGVLLQQQRYNGSRARSSRHLCQHSRCMCAVAANPQEIKLLLYDNISRPTQQLNTSSDLVPVGINT